MIKAGFRHVVVDGMPFLGIDDEHMDVTPEEASSVMHSWAYGIHRLIMTNQKGKEIISNARIKRDMIAGWYVAETWNNFIRDDTSPVTPPKTIKVAEKSLLRRSL